MPTPEMITLGLRRAATPEDQTVWLRSLVARAVAVVQALIEAESDPEDGPLLGELTQLAGMFGANPPASVPPDAGTNSLQRSRAVADRTRQRRAERRREMAAILALVRDVVSAATAEMMSLQSDIEVSGDRFEALVELEDPNQVKELLRTQVSMLKQMAVERRASWEARQQMFAEKVEHLEQQLEATRYEASLDPLTGVANHGAFQRECQNLVRRADSRFVLAILDVDDFKGVNDTYGHAIGDRVLLTLAQGLRRRLRDEDFVARVGGDEFVVLINNFSLRQAEARFGSALNTVFAPPEDGSEPLPVVPTVSCGLAEFSAGDTYASLYERADQALYTAKRSGKRRVIAKERPLMRDLMRR